jgi:Rod binding domain-containing protein
MATSSAFSLMGAQANALESREDRMIQLAKSPTGVNDDAKIEKGAKEFESILIGSWLQQAEQSFATVPGADDDEDPGREQMMSLGVQTLSTSMTASGGIGIAKMVAKAMHAAADKSNGQSATPVGQATGHESKMGLKESNSGTHEK